MPNVLIPSQAETTVDGFVERILQSIGREGDPQTETAVRWAMVRQLNSVRSERFHFTEATASFTLVADQSNYVKGVAATDLPADLLYIDVAKLTYGSSPTVADILDRIGIDEMRTRQAQSTNSGRSHWFTWWDDTFIIHPPPSTADTLQLDYHRDSTLTANGDVITINSNTETNDWFSFQGGEALLSAMVTAEVALRLLRDPELAQLSGALAQAERAKLRSRYMQESIGRTTARGWL